MSQIKHICVMGLGYIGLPTAALFADHGIQVVGVDVNAAIVESINRSQPHISEPELDDLLRKVVQNNMLHARTSAVAADAYIIAVPTPFKADHAPDMSFIEAAAGEIAPHLVPGNLVILESTSPVGTTEQLSQWLAALRPDLSFPHQKGALSDIRMAHCPERVLPGKILHEVVYNARIIGGMTRACSEAALALYKVLARGDIELASSRVAEIVKLAENSFRDVNIAFANELSVICDGLDVNVWDVIRLANLHPRVNILKPGPGVGGHCIAVDPWFIVSADAQNSRLIRTARDINDSKPQFVLEKVKAQAAKLKAPKIACLGLAYKANIGDVRESPAMHIVEQLAKDKVAELLVVEPHLQVMPGSLADLGLTLCDFDRACTEADILLLLVDHTAFLSISPDIKKDKIIIDTRGVW
jgi:UDP-N-acetyl-D-mannosaminuronic acid dehydrogenase